MSSPNHNPVVMVSHENNINETEDILFVRKKKKCFQGVQRVEEVHCLS